MKKIKGSKRGLTFTLDSLKIGTKYRYVIDKANKEIKIVPDTKGKITVSRKKSGTKIKPLLDIRCDEVKRVVSSADYLEISVERNGDLLVRTYTKIKQFLKKEVSIQEIIGTNTSEFIIPEKLLAVSGDYPTKLFGHATLADNAYYEYLGSTARCFTKPNLVKKDIKKVYDVMSLFSGAGMLDKAFLCDRFRFVYAVDFNEAAVQTYRANISEVIHCKDIRTVMPSEIPKADLAIGGPCCQSYSICNQKNTDTEESEAKRLLIDDYCRLVKAKNVKVFVIENVPTLLSKKQGYYFDRICNALSDYEITATVVNDCEVGGYSKRKRAIIIGSKIGKIELPKMKVVTTHTVREALAKVDSTWFNYADVTKPSKKTEEKMSYVPQGGNWEDIPAEIGGYGPNTQSNIMRRLELDKPSITLSNFRKSNILHPTENRILSISEASSISGFEKDFKFLGNLSDMQQMVANGVTFAIGKTIFRTILKALDSYYNIVVFNA